MHASSRRERFEIRPFVLIAIALLAAPAARAATLSLDERIAARRAVELVFWDARTWPAENPGVRPPLSSVLDDDTLRRMVEDDARKSAALATLWKTPLAAADVRAELERMTRDSRDPALLVRVFAALGDSARLALATLARPALADRELRSRYAWDRALHEPVRSRAERLLRAGCRASELDGGHAYTDYVLDGAGDEKVAAPGAGVVHVAPERWSAVLEALERRAPAVPNLAVLQEDEDRFFVEARVEQDATHVRVATVTWPKRPFDAWWSDVRNGIEPDYTVPEGEGEARSGGDGNVALPRPALDKAGACTDGDLYRFGNDAPAARQKHTAVWTGSEIVVWGGYSAATGLGLSTGGRYRPATDTWVSTWVVAKSPFVPRWSHTAVWTGSRMLIWGGHQSGTDDAEPFWSYDPVENVWLQLEYPPFGFWSRGEHVAVWTGTDMIVWGGREIGGTLMANGAVYNLAGDAWTTLPAAPITARLGHTGVWCNGSFIVFGGYGDAGYANDGASWNPQSGWTAIKDDLPPRTGHTAVCSEGRVMLVWGGRNGEGDVAPGMRYDAARGRWDFLPTQDAPVPRSRHTAVFTGTEMIVWGGVTSDLVKLDTGGIYSTESNTWLRMDMHGPPAARSLHTAVWAPEIGEMIVWGGAGAASDLATGSRYRRGANEWTPVSTSTGQASPTHPRIAWTGSELIVIADPVSATWNPALAAWRAIPAQPAAATSDDVAVWTGTEMIVWGGYAGSAGKNTGARYSPVTNAWTSTGIDANTPSARYRHAAVWSGTQMLVWGGLGVSSSDYRSDGARYAPATNTWSPVTALNAPTRRARHTAVWTGSEMIVWGGYGGGSSYDTRIGGAYSPSLDAWHTVPQAPIGERDDFTAVWTGTEMIVWGGRSTASVTTLADGARYNRAGDTWTSLTSAAPRESHTAVWTGREMILWGGMSTPSGDTPRTDAQRLEPPYGDPRLVSGEARFRHAAVWTGARMLAWGGTSWADATHDDRWSINDGRSGTSLCVACAELTAYPDADADTFGNSSQPRAQCWLHTGGYTTTGGDCNDNDATVWHRPSEATGLRLSGLTLSWNPVADAGGTGAVVYDVFRQPTPLSTNTDYGCLRSDVSALSTIDKQRPAAGAAWNYLVAGQNGCGEDLGSSTAGSERRPAACP